MARGAVAVVGAGPAGLAAALFLNRIGREVVILERFDTPRAVGSGLMLQPTGLAMLAALGLESAIRAHGRPITRMFGRSVPSDRVVLDVRYAALAPDAAGLAVHRSCTRRFAAKAFLSRRGSRPPGSIAALTAGPA